ncbi:hypothetical protein N5915_05750 [Arcobacter lacus]|uniref:hypothetical protein n=1 Tax=Arcobacter lacus TaxID=1912876 RepID=UPI0021BA816E|nr:hypothetical protein [Arcobacter lacus]MCT7909058.1 hypothetical protein [Arcobacter lacus]
MRILFILSIFISLAFSFAKEIGLGTDGLTKQYNGKISEIHMDSFYKKGGWEKLPSSVKNINGIDGLYIKRKNGVVSDVLITDSKYNTSKLGTIDNGTIKQMSKDWIKFNLDELTKKDIDPNLKKDYENIKKYVEKDMHKSQIFNVKPAPNGKYEVILSNVLPNGTNDVRLEKIKNDKKIYIDKRENRAIISSETKEYLKKDKAKLSELNRKMSTKTVFASKAIPIARIGASASKNIPIIGIAAQIAFDMYLFSEIDGLGEKIEENKEIINRIDEEVSLLNLKVEDYQEYTINKFSEIDEQIILNAKNIKNLEESVEKNQKDLENFKDVFYSVAIENLDKYLNDKNDFQKLNSSLNNLRLLIKSKESRDDISALVRNIYNIALVEEALYNKNKDKDIKDNKQSIKENFKEIVKFNDISNNTNSFISMQEVFLDNDEELSEITKIYADAFEKVFDENIKNNKYEDAIKLGSLYDLVIGQEYFEKAKELRKNNFEENKDKLDIFSIDDILSKNQNNLLNEEAIKKMYKENQFDKAINLLENKSLDNEEFRLRAFYAILNYRNTDNDKTKSEKLKKLILENPTYSEDIKSFVK